MASYRNESPFTVCFTSMKIRYNDYDKSIDGLGFVNQNDKVNVFINFESVLNNLSLIKDLDNKLLLERRYPIILESEMINLCAHYKRFFRGNGLDTRVFLYYTDLASDKFDNTKYNEDFRSFYINKYLDNPRFELLGNSLVDKIIPTVQKIMEFIPNVYFIKSNNIEGSLIPWIISKEYPGKNFIVSTDKYDTQYQLYDDSFCMHYIKRSPLGTSLLYTFEKYIEDLFKDNYKDNSDIELLHNSSLYSVLMASLGDKQRSIDPLKGVGYKTMLKMLSSGIKDGKYTKDTNSIDMISSSLPDELQDQRQDSYHCINLENQYGRIGEQNIFDIKSQIVDRFDYNSLITLNKNVFADYPLMLPELTC